MLIIFLYSKFLGRLMIKNYISHYEFQKVCIELMKEIVY